MSLSSIAALIKKSDIALALLCFALLNIGVGIAFSLSKKPMQLTYDVPNRTRSWYALSGLDPAKPAPDLVLLGASDMTCALYGAEATYLNKTVSQLTDHRSTYLEKKMAEAQAPYKTTHSLAVPGQMPSDQYFMARALVVNKLKPKAIYCTMVPRNFFDATFKNPSTSDVYKTTAKLGAVDVENELDSRKKDFFSMFDYGLSRLCPIYGHKQTFVSWQHHAVQSICRPYDSDFETVNLPLKLRKLALMELPEDYAPTEVGQTPYDPKTAVFLDNLPEYRVRYSQFSYKIYDQQFGYFKKLCELCNNEGIDLVVGNSPLTAENLAMVPEDIYKTYLDNVSSTVRTNGGVFLDLNLPGLFEHDDFFDSVHLNGKGGIKFLDYVADTMSTRSLAQKESLQTK